MGDYGEALAAGSAAPSEEWNRTFRGKDEDDASSVQQTADGGYVLAGSRGAGAGAHDAWLIKTDINGKEQWNLTFGGKFNAYSVAQTSDGGYILAGDAFLLRADDRDVWLIKLGREPIETADRTEAGISPVKKASGFEAVLSIAIILEAYITGRKMK